MAKKNSRAYRQELKRLETAKEQAKRIETSKQEQMKLETAKTEVEKLETTKEDVKRIATTKAEPVVKRIETMKNSGNAKVYLQYEGKEIDISAIVKKIEGCIDNPENLRVYIKPEDDKVYYACDDKVGDIQM